MPVEEGNNIDAPVHRPPFNQLLEATTNIEKQPARPTNWIISDSQRRNYFHKPIMDGLFLP